MFQNGIGETRFAMLGQKSPELFSGDFWRGAMATSAARADIPDRLSDRLQLGGKGSFSAACVREIVLGGALPRTFPATPVRHPI